MSGVDALTITVAICTHNRAGFLEKAIRSVLPQLTPDTELLVVDNASTDATRETCDRLARDTGVVSYHFEPRLGLSAARNTALHRARGEWVLFLDDDALAGPDWLATFRRFLADPPAPKIAVVGGGVIPYYTSPTPRWYGLSNGCFDKGPEPRLMAGGGLAGGNSIYLKAAVIAVGLYDERLGYKGGKLIPREESELEGRLIAAGWQCWWLPGAAIQHHVAADRLTVRKMLSSHYYGGQAAAIHHLKKQANGRQRFLLCAGRLVITPFHILINALEALVCFLLGQPKTAVGALCRVTRAAGWLRQIVRPS